MMSTLNFTRRRPTDTGQVGHQRGGTSGTLDLTKKCPDPRLRKPFVHPARALSVLTPHDRDDPRRSLRSIGGPMPPSPRHPPLTFPLCSRQGRGGLLHEVQHGAFVNTKLIEPSKFKLLACTLEILTRNALIRARCQTSKATTNERYELISATVFSGTHPKSGVSA